MRLILLILVATACVRPAEKPQKDEKLTIAEFTRSYVISCQDVCQIWGIKRVTLSSKGSEFYSTCECNEPINVGVQKIKPKKQDVSALLEPKQVESEPIRSENVQSD